MEKFRKRVEGWKTAREKSTSAAEDCAMPELGFLMVLLIERRIDQSSWGCVGRKL
jgi:hypothetical protein